MSVQYSIVIPVYNGARSLTDLYTRLSRVIEGISQQFEIIFVDDASNDDSWKLLLEFRRSDGRVKIIQLMRNFGQHNAIMCGLHHAQGKYIVTMDDDLQNPPEEIPKLIAKINEGYDLVYGEYLSKRHSFLRNFGSRFVQFMYKKVFGVKNNITAFRIVKKPIIDSILNYDKNYVFIDGLLAWSSINIGQVMVEHEKRTHGKSGYSLRKLFTLSLNMVTNFSILPLQLASILGYVFALVGLGMALYFILKKLFFEIPVTGYASLIVAVTIFAGIQLITIGLVGEYLGRIHLNINSKPQFLIRQSIIE